MGKGYPKGHKRGLFAANPPGTGSGFDYSTTEFDTGQKWIDDKTIFGKVIDDTGSGTYSTGSNPIPHGITNLDRVLPIPYQGILKRDFGGQQIRVPFVSSAALQFQITLSFDPTNIILTLGTSWSGTNNLLSDGQFVIFYTKTT